MVLKSIKSSIILLLCCLMPFRAFGEAQTSTGTFFILKKGNFAPFDGILFDPYAMGTLLTEKETLIKENDLKLRYELEKQEQKFVLDQQNLKITLRSQHQVHESIIKMKDKEIKTLQDVKETSFLEIMMYVGGGVILGGFATALAFGISGFSK